MALDHTIKFYRGNFANLPTTGLSVGMPLVTLDRKTLHVAEDATTLFTVTPALEQLTTLGTVAGADDYVLIHDNSEATGQKEKKMTFNAFKTALNIPESSTDELVAVVDGGTSGYLWGTTGSDGVLRADATLSYTKDAGNAFVTFGIADGGVDTLQLAADAVDGTKIADDAVDSEHIADLAVGTAAIAADAVTGAKIADNAVANEHIATGAVDTDELATDAVTTIKIAGLAVTTAKLAAGAVTNAKLDASALSLDGTTFSGNGVTTPLDIAVIDGGTF